MGFREEKGQGDGAQAGAPSQASGGLERDKSCDSLTLRDGVRVPEQVLGCVVTEAVSGPRLSETGSVHSSPSAPQGKPALKAEEAGSHAVRRPKSPCDVPDLGVRHSPWTFRPPRTDP